MKKVLKSSNTQMIQRVLSAMIVVTVLVYLLLMVQPDIENSNTRNINSQIYLNPLPSIDKVKINSSVFANCGKMPSEIDVDNVYWQKLETANGSFRMVNAYYDNKRRSFSPLNSIRIIAYINRVYPTVTTFCQLWFEGVSDSPVLVKASYEMLWIRKYGVDTNGSHPFMINCENTLAKYGMIPTSVSLVEDKCSTSRNKLEVDFRVPADGKKKLVAVCVKDTEFEDDNSMILIEWLEIVKLLGADKVFIYVVKVHPNAMKVLKHFESQGFVEIEIVTLPEGFPGKNNRTSLQYRLQQMISLNDCLYKHMHEYKLLLSLDFDELILPSREEDKTWFEMLNRTSEMQKDFQNVCFLAADHVFFLAENDHENETQPEVPAKMHFLQRVYRSKNVNRPWHGIKSFQVTENTILMHNHKPFVCAYAAMEVRMKRKVSRLHHYRRGCSNCGRADYEDFRTNIVKDLTLWKYKNEIIENVNKTMKELEFT